MAGRHRNLILDQELDGLIEADAQRRGISVSAAMRDALRAYYAAGRSVEDRAWQEAYTAAMALIRRRINQALADIPEFPDQG